MVTPQDFALRLELRTELRTSSDCKVNLYPLTFFAQDLGRLSSESGSSAVVCVSLMDIVRFMGLLPRHAVRIDLKS